MDVRSRRPIAAVARAFVVISLALAALAVPGGVAAADAAGTCSSASVAQPTNTSLHDTIGSATDVDWFRFTTTTATWTLVTLGHLPADYDLSVYSGCGTLVATSHRSGRTYDEVYANLPAGTYQVKVVGFGGAFSATSQYSLRFRPLAWGIPILSSTTSTDASGYLHVAGEVLNNTADSRRWIEIDATFLDAAGATVDGAVGYTDVAKLAPRTRSPFEIVARRPAAYARTTVRVCTPSATGGCLSGQVSTAPIGALPITAGPSTLDASGRRHLTGTVRNANSGTAYLTQAVTTLYDADGNVAGLGAAFTKPSAIAPGASAPFEVVATGSASPNRVGYQAQARAAGCASGPRYTAGGQENVKPPLARTSASGRVALTFDMGGRMTPAVRILNLLIANGVCATIFPTGAISRTAEGQAALAVVKAHPELFEVGNHTMHHCDLVRGGGGSPGAADSAYCATLAPSPSEAAVKQELTDGETWIRTYVGVTTKPFWRAPYRAMNATILAWAAQAGWTKQIDFDVDTIDWRPIADGGPTARSMTLKVVNNAKSGSVVLMHLGGFETLDALPSIIDGLRSRGFILTTVSDLAQ
jgi:peptidoglycan/xylan/chitin deacetylase (PgdA/CDA1 family)